MSRQISHGTGEEGFAFSLPLEPHSYRCKLGGLEWGLELLAEGTAQSTAGTLGVSPTGREIMLSDAD